MTDERGPRDDRDPAARYEVRVEGHLDGRWAAWFDELSLRHEAGGQTVIHGRVANQAALHGLLRQVRDIGLRLVSVTRVDDDARDHEADPGPSQLLPDTERNDET